MNPESDHLVVPVEATGASYLSFAPGVSGWAIFITPEHEPGERMMFVRFGRSERTGVVTRIVAREAKLAFRESVRSSALRDLPLTRLEAAVNQPAYREDVLKRVPPHFWIMEPFPWGSPEQPSDWWFAKPSKRRAPKLTLEIPPGRPKPDSFYEQVAERFLYLNAVSRRPAADLAEANGVPVTTVHGWVKEARRRGLLPSGEWTRGGGG